MAARIAARRDQMAELHELLAQFEEDLADCQALAAELTALRNDLHQLARQAKHQSVAERPEQRAYHRGQFDAFTAVIKRLDDIIDDRVTVALTPDLLARQYADANSARREA